MKISVKVEGLKELDKALSELSEDMRGKALYEAIGRASAPMLKDAKAGAAIANEPHEMRYKGQMVKVQPGLLKSAIRRKRLKKHHDKHTAAVMIYIGRGTKQKIYPYYWHFIEFGTKKMPATPFMRPAFERNRAAFVERFKQHLAKSIQKRSQ